MTGLLAYPTACAYHYLGQAADEGEARVRDAYGPDRYERLVALKEQYDPGNLFRFNQNIKPAR